MTHGGKRENAGRKRSGIADVRRTVSLPWTMVGDLLVLGGGNLSEGIRRLHARYIEQSATDSEETQS